MGKTKNRTMNRIVLLFAATYMVSYITRINYGAIISEMVTATGMSKTMLSLGLTGSFITYGAGQVISGICGDKFSPKKLVSVGLTTAVFMNVLIPFCNSAYQMLGVWCINGFGQAFMWPPMVKLMSSLLSVDEYKQVSVKVSCGSSIGTIAVYLFAPIAIHLFDWKSVFWFSALCGAVMIFVWNRFCCDVVRKEEETKTVTKEKNLAIIFSPVMIAIMFAILLQGMLRDGVTTWMPSYISETYNLGNAVSILTGVALPIFTICSFEFTSRLHRNKFTNPVTCASVIFAVGALSALGLFLFSDTSVAMSILFSALLTGSMHGANLMLVGMVPSYFQKYGNVSTAAGVINACTYIGSAVSTYGIAVLSEKFGWSFTVMVWVIIAFLGTIICSVCAKKFHLFAVEE